MLLPPLLPAEGTPALIRPLLGLQLMTGMLIVSSCMQWPRLLTPAPPPPLLHLQYLPGQVCRPHRMRTRILRHLVESSLASRESRASDHD
jgi:hypothetical protein